MTLLRERLRARRATAYTASLGNQPDMPGGDLRCWLTTATLMTVCWALFPACSEKRLDIPARRCSGLPVPNTHIEAHLVSGSVAFPFDGGPVQSRPLVQGADVTAQGVCVAMLSSVVRPSAVSNGTDGSLAGDSGMLWLSCSRPQELFIVGINPRLLTTGTHVSPFTPADPNFMPTIDPSGWGSSCQAMASYRITAEITGASGEAVPYPDMVTPDYARRGTIRLEGVADPSNPGAGCSNLVPAVEVSFTESVADVVKEPDAVELCL
jgi:hypothetical protein